VVGERLELEVVVADILVLWDTSVVGERLCDPAVVGEALVLELEELVADTLVLDEVVALALDEILVDKLEVELRDGELDVTDPAPTATNAIFED
jgi:hypothetical protein